MRRRDQVPRVHLGLQACQGPEGYLWHGIGRYVREQTVHLLRDHRELIAGLHLDRELPVPRTLGDFCGYGLLREYPPSGDGLSDEDSGADVFHVTSPFWPNIPLYRLIPSPFLHAGAKLIVTLYDLIPLIFEDQYLSDPWYKQWFTSRLKLIQEADHVLAISETTRDDAVRLLGLDPERTTVIYGGVRDDFRQADKPAEVVRARVIARLPEIRGPYVLYSAGTAQFRKNIGGAIEAYARLPLRLRETMQLVATGYFLEAQRKVLEEQARKQGVQARLVLPGFVTEDLLRELYQACELCIYPSLYEGFGLPILEAMRCGAAVVTSDRSSTKELVEIPEARFDPEDPSHMVRVMERALSDEDLRQELREYGLQRSRQFTWERVAQVTADCYREVGASMVQQGSRGRKRPMLLAFCTPYPPEQSGVADYSEVFLKALCARHSLEVDVVVKDDPKSYVPPGHPAIRLISARQFRWLAEHGHYDAIVYCMGNSPFHDYIHALLKEHPGVVWLHDVRLTDFYRWYFVQGGRDLSMLPEELLPWVRRYPDHEGDLLMRDNATYHAQGIYLAGEVASYARKIIVNSRFSEELVEIESGGSVPVVALPFAASRGVGTFAPMSWPELASKYRLDETATPVVSVGIIGPPKCPEDVIEGFVAADPAANGLVLVFVGEFAGGRESTYRQELDQLFHGRGIEDHVRVTGFVEEAEFSSWLAVARCAIQLRFPTNGESSAAVMDCLTAGVPTIVSDHGPLRELPDDAVTKVPAPVEPAALGETILRLLSDDKARKRLHRGALRYAQETSYDVVADRFWTEVLCPSSR
jgi:glycosyltransferase involved in cell wall biosynthesis